MNKFAPLALIATVATIAVIPSAVFAAETTQNVQAAAESAAPVANLVAGKVLYGSNGRRIAAIYRVNAAGAPQVIINGRLITVPAATLSDVGGKITTSLSKLDLTHAR